MDKEIKYCNHEGTEEDPCECEVVEFNLSEKIKVLRHETRQAQAIWIEDIKEFIKRNLELIKLYHDGKISYFTLLARRDKLTGEKLICQK